ncbi:hypothetical protein [Caenibius tardaugens]|uniref:hypothetical protein n=1 Tax=Caenibius tardaugens TaxID=169176 RepID=UPI0012EB3A60|nr:hypothetical protein [Caenibius tardaugens]
MSALTLSDGQAGAFKRFRRRTWIAIGLCLAFRAGDAALQATTPIDISNQLISSEDSHESLSSRDCRIEPVAGDRGTAART